MLRLVLRVILVVIVVVAGAFLLLGYWAGQHGPKAQPSSIGTSGSANTEKGSINTDKARQVGAAIGEKTAQASAKVQETVSEASLTAKIKAKMALDDSVKSRTIDVTTNGTTVTLSGTVGSAAEHERAVALARETTGVAQVVDHLTVQR